MPDFNRPVFAILGLPFDAITSEDAIAKLELARNKYKRCFLSTPNINFLIASASNKDFRESVSRSDLSVADGMPIIWIARLLGIPIKERVAGSNLFEQLMHSCGYRWRVFCFGGNQGVAMNACIKLERSTGVEPVGIIYPGFGSLDEMSDKDLIDLINASAADFLLVSLGAVKGQAWIMKNQAYLNVPVISHLGAVLNFIAGNLKRSPPIFQKNGLEWLWRVKEEPTLWKRYFKDGLSLLKLLILGVLPLMLIQFLCKPKPSETALTTYRYENSASSMNIFINGPSVFSNLQNLRQLLSRLQQNPRSVNLNLSHCSWIDSAFCGLMMILASWLTQQGLVLHITGASSSIRRLLYLHGLPMNYLEN